MKRKVTFVFAGPSGGHLFPAVAFAESYRELRPDENILLVTGRRAHAFKTLFSTDLFNEIIYVEDFVFTRGMSPGQFFRAFGSFLTAAIRTAEIFFRYSPRLAVGFGSYVSLPGIFLAWIFRIPILLHEQNVVPGKATRCLSPLADAVALSFEETRLPRTRGKKISVSGLPLRCRLKQAAGLPKPEKQDARLWFLIVGGSQGAANLNRLAWETFSLLNPEEKAKIAVIHITGEKDYAEAKSRYEAIGLCAEIFSFHEHLEDCYRKADFAITRAGANTMFELALFRLPAVVVPYPYAMNHQRENAEIFAAKNAIILQDEKKISPDWLVRTMRDFITCPQKIDEYAARFEEFNHPEAASMLAKTAVELSETGYGS